MCSANLVAEFNGIRQQHLKAEQHRFARAVLGSSVIRVFAGGSREMLLASLTRIRLQQLEHVNSEREFRAFFNARLSRLARVIRRTNPKSKNSRIYPGYKWGHATKILCLFLRDVVLHSHRFPPATVRRLSRFLYVPIDNVVIDRLRVLGVPLQFHRINQIRTSRHFFGVQHILGEASTRARVPRVWFDDIWGLRQPTSNRPSQETRRKRRAPER